MSSDILQQTQVLAYDNYKAFIHTANCSRAIFKDFNVMEQSVQNSLEQLPALSRYANPNILLHCSVMILSTTAVRCCIHLGAPTPL